MLNQRRSWHDPISQLKGIGPKSSEKLNQLGIFTVKDLLFHFPFRYENIQQRDLATVLDQEKISLVGTIVSPATVSYFGKRKNRLQFKMALTSQEVIQVVFFNQAYLAKQIHLGQKLAVYGKWQAKRQSLTAIKLISQSMQGQDYQAVYHLKQGISQNQLLRAIQFALNEYWEFIPEILPQSLNHKYQLLPLKEALKNLHFPTDIEHHRQGERKIIYQEFFLYQWRIQQASKDVRQEKGLSLKYDVNYLRQTIGQLAFELTDAQKQALNEICYDLLAPYPMLRLLQGEVGSGKTIVAFLACIAALSSGHQAAIMVPTEILAKQHYESFISLFEFLARQTAYLVSGLKKTEKERIYQGLASGAIKLVIGTHALIQDQLKFNRLGLVIIDEQHRFGVGQRQALLAKAGSEYQLNILQMTATPIPRSLAMSLYGQMQVSTIDQLPAGRKRIITKVITADYMDKLYQKIRELLSLNQQIYYVLPFIEDSESLTEVESVSSIYQQLREIFPDTSIGVLHGQMKKEDQESVMQAFSQDQLQILIATTMIEVGINVPNATMMVIHSAERFGLAQLHQLRGRVGRGSLQSYCYLVAKPTTEQAKERLNMMEQSQDGFELSQTDMKIRGMGDLLGRQQSGLPQFHYANLFEDQQILELARQDVIAIMRHPQLISAQEYAELQKISQEVSIEI